jgi:23S rRNA (guanosine2251-2'-O)-methyltransferase
VVAAIVNPKRDVVRVMVTKTGREQLNEACSPEELKNVNVELVESDTLMKHAPENVPNQGMVAQVTPLAKKNIQDLNDPKLVMFLDQVNDPHNIGAILRSCAAFGVDALLVHEQSSPDETPTMAKSASGALEVVPLIRVSNVVKAMEELKEKGFWFLGMDGKAEVSLKDAPSYDKVAIVMGAEGKGLRRLTIEQCDVLVKLPIKRTIESLNVSNAAAIALYELS